MNSTSTNINRYDESVITDKVLNFNTDNGLLSTGNYQNSENIINESIESVFGTGDINDAGYRLILIGTLNNYLKDTNNFVIFNDLANNNAYVAESLKTETDKMDNIREKTVNNTYKKQNQFFQKKYVINYNNFIKNIIKYIFLLSIVILLIVSFYLQGKVSKFLSILVISILVVLSFVVILIYVKNIQTRRKDDWSKYYFSGMENDKTASSCTPSAPATSSEFPE